MYFLSSLVLGRVRLLSFVRFLLFLCVMLFGCLPAYAVDTNFTFTVGSRCHTSAAVYNSSGVLVRTLWRDVTYNGGTFSAIWDGKDDAGTAASAGTYTIKVLGHNVDYVWEGVIGNTSDSFTGTNIWRAGSGTMPAMAFGGSKGFGSVGYNEGSPSIFSFAPANPQHPTPVLPGDGGTAYQYLATDGTILYAASTGGFDPNNFNATFVVGFDVSSETLHTFPSGTPININANYNGIYSTIDLSQKTGTGANDFDFKRDNAATGLAVQQTGNVLAVAHGPLNVIRFFDKTSGAAIGTPLSVTAPRGISFDSNGTLWVCSETNVFGYTYGSSTPHTTIHSFANPITTGTHPSNGNVLVADGGTSQQIKAFNLASGTYDSNTNSLWTLGTAGGYNTTNGPTVTNTKFMFANPTYIVFQSDGSFWVGDQGNQRNLHFSSTRTYIDQIAYVINSLSSVDPNNPTRVFSNFLEYQVNYGVPLQPGDPDVGNGSWKLVKNWNINLSADYFGTGFVGLSTVVTLSNGRTYALIPNQVLRVYEVAELPVSGPLRFPSTPIRVNSLYSLYENGDLRHVGTGDDLNNTGIQTLYNQTLSGFDGSGNPQWSASTVLSSAPGNATTEPAPQPGDGTGSQGLRFPSTSTNVIASFKQGGGRTGWHLGGMTPGGTTWRWKAAPSNSNKTFLDGQGSFDLISNGGNAVIASGRNIVYGYNGEFWNGGQANQYMHFYDNGLFIGQFGQWNRPDIHSVIPGVAGNAYSPAIVVSGGNTYVWNRDEGSHGGLHRWRVANLNTIGELSATVTLGGSATLSGTAPVASSSLIGPSAPTGIVAVAGSDNVTLNWAASSNAVSYKVKRTSSSGGGWQIIATAIAETTFTDRTALNGNTYYYAVSAWGAAGNGPDSSGVIATPGVDSGIYEAEQSLNPPGLNPNLYASNGEFVNGLGTATFINVDGGSGGTTNVKIGYANGSNATLSVGVNGGALNPVVFPSTGGFGNQGTWGSVTISLPLGAGATNTIVIKNDYQQGINLDYIQVLDSPKAPTGLTATGGTNKVTLAWNGSTGAGSYKVYRGTTSNGQSATALATITNDTNYVDNTAVSGTTYFYKLTALNSTGESPRSAEASAAPTGSVPSAPTGLTATSGNLQIDLNWTATSGATSYNVYRGTTSGGQSTTPIATGVTGTTYPNTGLTNGTAYFYKIKAVNGVGTSAYSNEASATPAATGTGSNYLISKTLGIARNDFSGWLGMKITVGGTPITVSQLGRYVVAGNTGTHTVKLTLVSTGTDVSGGSVSVATAGATAGQFKYVALAAPVTLNANTSYYVSSQEFSGGDQFYDSNTTITTTSAATVDTAFWNNGGWFTAGTGPNTTYIPVDFNYTSGVATVAAPTFSPVAGIYTSAQSVTITSATSGASIRYTTNGTAPTSTTGTLYSAPVSISSTSTLKAIAYKSGSTDSSVTSGAYTINLPPSAPTGLTATAGDLQIDLNWTATSGATSYNVYRGTTSGGQSTTAIATGITGTTYTNTGLTNGTAYFYKIKAVNAGGTSGYSNEATATPAAALTTYLTGKTLGTTRNDFGGWLGMKITVGSSPITVKQLGRYVVSGNTGTHTVKLTLASTGADVSGGSVSVATSGATAGQFKYVALSAPITLSANTSYYISSQEFNGGDQFYDSNTTITTTAVATVDTAFWNNGAWYTAGTGSNTTYIPVDFKY